ncbi:hypothetical protein BDW75DRAFT_239814 [Aspergillus navahoensis]
MSSGGQCTGHLVGSVTTTANMHPSKNNQRLPSSTAPSLSPTDYEYGFDYDDLDFDIFPTGLDPDFNLVSFGLDIDSDVDVDLPNTSAGAGAGAGALSIPSLNKIDALNPLNFPTHTHGSSASRPASSTSTLTLAATPLPPLRPHPHLFLPFPPQSPGKIQLASRQSPLPIEDVFQFINCLPDPEGSSSSSSLSSPSAPKPTLSSTSKQYNLRPKLTTAPPSPGASGEEQSTRTGTNRVTKRQLNTEAARRYRQRKIDRMNQLEEELEIIKAERDQLKMKVSKLVGETEGLKRLLDLSGGL